jgi:hypothetical protein
LATPEKRFFPNHRRFMRSQRAERQGKSPALWRKHTTPWMTVCGSTADNDFRRGSDLGYTRLLVDRGGTGDATVTF